jgi:hypothetical protein
VLVGFTRDEATFCRRYRVVARVQMPFDNEERNRPIARCKLADALGRVWPQVVAAAAR